jgi:hypothetical protein
MIDENNSLKTAAKRDMEKWFSFPTTRAEFTETQKETFIPFQPSSLGSFMENYTG